MTETKRRSLAKAMSWRVFATLITSTVVFVLTGEFEFALTVGFVDTIIKIFVYYIHERLWIRIPFGKTSRDADYQI